MTGRPPIRDVIFITHAAPEDNQVALWLSSKLTLAGYKVWIDRKRLQGGDDSWDKIDRVLRNEAIKQIVIFTSHNTKNGVKKELAIGDIMRTKLADQNFIIPIRMDDTPFNDAPPEFVRGNIINSFPDWHDCLSELFETLENAEVPKLSLPDSAILKTIVDAREDGRRFIKSQPENLLTNWFPIKLPKKIRYYKFDGLQDHKKAWLNSNSFPKVSFGLLSATFFDFETFCGLSDFKNNITTAYEIPLNDFIDGGDLGPNAEVISGHRDISNLLRQHFDIFAAKRGLSFVEFANRQKAWFFADGLIDGPIVFVDSTGRRIRRNMTGKFKKLRWHACLIAKPILQPMPTFRIHINVVLTEDGKTPISWDKTTAKRIRVTKSWWNDVWRDRLIAAVHFLAEGQPSLQIDVGDDIIEVDAKPISLEIPVSYEATDPPHPIEEDEEGNVVPSAELDDPYNSEFEDEEEVEETV